MRIRVVEDEPLLADAVAVHLTRAGHAVDCVGRLDDADASLDATEFGLVILDLHLPDGRAGGATRAVRSSRSKGFTM